MLAVENVRKFKETVMKSKAAEQYADFTYYEPNAKKVCLAGPFNAWNTKSLPMKKGSDGNWKIKILLSAGKHEYKYFVDNAWCEDVPGCEMMPNAYGTSNYVVEVK